MPTIETENGEGQEIQKKKGQVLFCVCFCFVQIENRTL